MYCVFMHRLHSLLANHKNNINAWKIIYVQEKTQKEQKARHKTYVI